MTVYEDERVVTLLREVELPASPPDRVVSVSRRARAAESRRLSLLASAMSIVLVAGIVGAVSLHGRSNEQVLTVASAAKATIDTGSARVTLTIQIAGSTFTLHGPVDFAHSSYLLTGSFGGAPMEMRGIGRDRWTKGGGLAFGGKPWVHSTESVPTQLSSTTQPVVLLQNLMEKGKQLSSHRDGDRTTLVLRVPEGVLSGIAVQKDLVDVTVSVDEDDLIRRLSYRVSDGGSTVRLTLAYDEFGIDVNVSPPPADQVQESGSLGGGVQTEEHFSTTTGSSPADKKRACDMIRAVLKQQPTPTNEQQKAAYEQFKKIEQQVCAKS